MSLYQTLKDRLLEARKASNSVHLGVLQVVLGEVSMAEARGGKLPGDDEIEKIIRKILLGNTETLGILERRGMAGNENHAKLTSESQLLMGLLPKTLSVDEIVAALGEVQDAIKGAKNDGQATGVAMKHLKGKGLRVLGEDVGAAIKKVRG